MTISKISESYELRDLELAPDQLLLDPNNPRIVLETQDEFDYSHEELSTPEVQDYILSVIDKAEYHVAELIESIRTSGFLPGLHEIIVKRIGKTRKYLVLEGNRRLTAIRHLLEKPEGLERGVRKTLNRLPVKEFVFRGDGLFSEEEVIDIILGSIHMQGPLEWQPIEKAHYVHKSYMRAMEKAKAGKRFRYDVDLARTVAPLFSYPVRRVRKELAVYRVYDQLKRNAYKVKPSHYSLIEMAVKNRALNYDYFELDRETLRFSPVGLERFGDLCIEDGSPVSNPKDFRLFADVYASGTPHEVNLAASGAEPIEEVARRLNSRLDKKQFRMELEDIKASLESLVISDFQETAAERNLIREIQGIVLSKLLPLAGEADGMASINRQGEQGLGSTRNAKGSSSGKAVRPSDVQEALRLNPADLAVVIERVLRNRPHGSCVREKLPKYVLQHWSIRSRGKPRQRFCEFVERVVGEMIRTGEIQPYKATNERLRLMED